MSINLTLFGQMITFAIFVIFTMKFVWPHIQTAMTEREKKIAAGLASAEQAQKDLELAQQKALKIIKEAKEEASQMIDKGNRRANEVVEHAKEQARLEGQRMIEQAKTEIDKQAGAIKRDLQQQVADLAVQMTEKLLKRSIDKESHRDILNKVVEEI